jgi:hypothetical protein
MARPGSAAKRGEATARNRFLALMFGRSRNGRAHPPYYLCEGSGRTLDGDAAPQEGAYDRATAGGCWCGDVRDAAPWPVFTLVAPLPLVVAPQLGVRVSPCPTFRALLAACVPLG